MRAWGEQQNAEEITLLADIGAEFSKALGTAVDMPHFGGLRSQRYSMNLDKGVVTRLYVEEPKKFEVSDAQTIIDAL